MRLIDAEAALKVLCNYCGVEGTCPDGGCAEYQKMSKLPTAKIKKRAHWKDAYNGRYANPIYICSVCRKPALYILKRCELGNWSDTQALSAYCPHCGREMTNGGKDV